MIFVVLRLLSNTRGSQILVTLSRMFQIACGIREGRSMGGRERKEEVGEDGKEGKDKDGGIAKATALTSAGIKVKDKEG